MIPGHMLQPVYFGHPAAEYQRESSRLRGEAKPRGGRTAKDHKLRLEKDIAKDREANAGIALYATKASYKIVSQVLRLGFQMGP